MAAANDTNTIDRTAVGDLHVITCNLDGAQAVLEAAMRHGENVDCRTCGAVLQLLTAAKDRTAALLSKEAPVEPLDAPEFSRRIESAIELAATGMNNDRGSDSRDSGLTEPLAWLASQTIADALDLAEAVQASVESRVRDADAVPA